MEIAPGVFSLGRVVLNGRVFEGIALADHKGRPHGKPPKDDPRPKPTPEPTPPPDLDPAGTDASCFSFIWAAGYSWSAVEPYSFNPAGAGIDVGVGDLDAALTAWEAAALTDIFGAGGETSARLTAESSGGPDGSNEAYFARIVGPGARGTIAFTVLWADTQSGEIVEWDMVFNTRFDWSVGDPAASDAMDFLNIATHEAGRAAGLGHTEKVASCENETMFPTASNGEIMQRTLEAGDTAGAGALYAP